MAEGRSVPRGEAGTGLAWGFPSRHHLPDAPRGSMNQVHVPTSDRDTPERVIAAFRMIPPQNRGP